jgi:hypothetical protein
MKIGIKYVSFFGLGILLFLTLISMSKSPETKLEGEWKELIWEYEKVNKINDTTKEDYTHLSDYVKAVVGQNLVIHKAEKWIFRPNGKLILQGSNYSKEVSWNIKGRGNVLELKYDDSNVEHYNLTQLTDNQFILNFDTDTHTRGIARLTFEKIN